MRGSKKAGPAPSKSAPLKLEPGDVIPDQGKQLECWVEHYLQPYATQNVVTDDALSAILNLPVFEELNDPPTEEELSKPSSASPASDFQRAGGEDIILAAG